MGPWHPPVNPGHIVKVVVNRIVSPPSGLLLAVLLGVIVRGRWPKL